MRPWRDMRVEIDRGEPDAYQCLCWRHAAAPNHLHKLRFRENDIVRHGSLPAQPYLNGTRIEGDVQRQGIGARKRGSGLCLTRGRVDPAALVRQDNGPNMKERLESATVESSETFAGATSVPSVR